MPAASSTSGPETQAVIAIDLGGTKLASALFTEEGRPDLKCVTPLAGRCGRAVGALVVAEVSRLRTAAACRGMAVTGVGVAVPGIAHARTGTVWAPNIPGWEDYPLRDEIKMALADPAINVVVDSDRAAAILGEAWQGAARGCRDAIFLAVGTGIGAGILVDGRVLHGADGIAGAIGWLALDRRFKPEYAACGCFESHASGEGLARVAKEVLRRRRGYHGHLRAEEQLSAHALFDAYEQGDAVAEEVMSEAIEFWGMASANLVSLLNPEKVVFGGGVFGPATRFLEAIAAEARRWAQPVSITKVKFEPSQLAGDAVLYGAAFLARRRVRRHSQLAESFGDLPS
jgi:glucokinase